MTVDATPNKILLAIPCGDGRIWAETVMSIIPILAASEGRIQPFWSIGDSNIAHCRNSMVHFFLTQTDCDTLFWLDSDIVFTPQDFAYMLEGDEQIVIAPYARKVFGMQPTGFGMGFCRIHRSVYTTLNEAVDEEGQEACQRYYLNGEVATHFHFTGASTDARWFGEDTGFWHFCALKQMTQRLERRTRLGHIGLFKYEYPNQLPDHVTPYSGPGAYPMRIPGFDDPEVI